MRLTAHTDYSIRVLMYLNQIHLSQEKRSVTLSELSGKLGVSRNNLIKVSNQLEKLSFIESARGRRGGLAIREGTGGKTLKDIVMRTEETFHIAECFSDKKCDCVFLRNCLLRKCLSEALQAFVDTLGKKTLNDITPAIKR